MNDSLPSTRGVSALRTSCLSSGALPLSLCCLLMFLAHAGRLHADEKAAQTDRTNTPVNVFVATFENLTGDPLYDPVSSGLADLLAVRLAECPGVVVLDRRDLAMVNREVAMRLASTRDEGQLALVARPLNASHVISGRIYKGDSGLRVVARALEIASAKATAAAEIATTTDKVIAGAGELASQLARQLGRPPVATPKEKVDVAPTVGLCAAQGLSSFYAGDMEQAIVHFMRAVDLDPDYTDAIYWSALSYQRLGQNDHAAMDCVEYLKKAPKGRFADAAGKLLAALKQRLQSDPVKMSLLNSQEEAK